jgi:hypothetical protein
MSNADIGRSHALNTSWALKHFEGYGYLFNRQFSNWVGQTSSKKNQASSCFAWEKRLLGCPSASFTSPYLKQSFPSITLQFTPKTVLKRIDATKTTRLSNLRL